MKAQVALGAGYVLSGHTVEVCIFKLGEIAHAMRGNRVFSVPFGCIYLFSHASNDSFYMKYRF